MGTLRDPMTQRRKQSTMRNLIFIADDGQALSFKSAKENIFQCARAIRDKHNNGWRIVAVEVNWENPALFCSHSGERIESAYAEDEAT